MPGKLTKQESDLLAAALQETAQDAVDQLIALIKGYTAYRANEVTRGAETPHLAALLLQKYAFGVTDAAVKIFELMQWPQAARLVGDVVEDEVRKIDPDWQAHGKERWAYHPADIVNKVEKNCRDAI